MHTSCPSSLEHCQGCYSLGNWVLSTTPPMFQFCRKSVLGYIDCIKSSYSERVERNQKFVFVPLWVLSFLLNKSSTIKWVPRRVLEFPWIYEVPSNPQLILVNFPRFLSISLFYLNVQFPLKPTTVWRTSFIKPYT